VRITGRARLDPTVRATEHNTNISRYPIPNAVQALLNAMCPPRRGIASRLVRSQSGAGPRGRLGRLIAIIFRAFTDKGPNVLVAANYLPTPWCYVAAGAAMVMAFAVIATLDTRTRRCLRARRVAETCSRRVSSPGLWRDEPLTGMPVSSAKRCHPTPKHPVRAGVRATERRARLDD
jgi:hypothetical protein